MKVVYSARYHVDIGLHVFPTQKFELVHARLMGDRSPSAGGIRPVPLEIVEPEPASWEQLALVHTSEYLGKMRMGTLSEEDLAQLALPWSPEIVDGFRTMVGGTIQAARLACGVSDVAQGSGSSVVVHIGGGLHHAFPNHGEGFCPFNDVAVAVRVLQSHGLERVAIIDLDVHHGNGTAFIFNPRGTPPRPLTRSHRGASAYPEEDVADRHVFTFSMHQQHNYPMWKPRGSLDIGLPDGTHDDTFLAELKRALPAVMKSRPQCVFYLAGADPYEEDQLGGLRLTKEGLRERDRIVIEAVRATGVALVVVLAGGYARRVADTVAIHVATVEEAEKASGAGSTSA
jgi:acetoin utilization deacetylase AcuC-like enzyme